MKEASLMSDVRYSQLAKSFKPGRYRHYKGNYYVALGVSVHSETLEELVVYIPQYPNEVLYWVRPLAMFLEEVIVDGKVMPRFEYIGD